MNWFRRKIQGTGGQQPLSPKKSDSFNHFLLLFLAFLAGVILLKTGTLTSWTMTLLMLMAIGAMMRSGMFETDLSGCVFSSRYDKARGTLAGEIQEESLWQICKLPLNRSYTFSWVNDYAASSLTGGGLYKAESAIWQRIRRQRLSSPFSVTSFNGHVCFCADSQETSAQGQRLELPEERRVLTSRTPLFNDCVGFSWTAGGLCKVEEEMCQGLRGLRLSLPFLVASFAGMYKDACYQKDYTQYAKSYAYGDRESFEKVTCQTDSKNGFTEIGNSFRNEFSSGVVNDRFHRFNDNMIGDVCQTQFSRVSRVFTSNLASFRAFGLDNFLTFS